MQISSDVMNRPEDDGAARPGLRETLYRFHVDESGATATEYLILLVLVACFIIAVVKLFGETLEEKYGWADERVYKFVTF